MSPTETAIASSVVAVYPDHAAAEGAVRQLHEAGFDLGDLSIVGRDFQETDEPCGLVSRGDYVKAGAETGSLFGLLFGLCIGAGFLVLPGIGLVVVAGPIAAALLAGIEGALAGTALGSLAGALVGWHVPKDRAIKYERAGQRGQVSRLRPVHPRGRRPRPEPARRPRAGSHRALRAAGIINPDTRLARLSLLDFTAQARHLRHPGAGEIFHGNEGRRPPTPIPRVVPSQSNARTICARKAAGIVLGPRSSRLMSQLDATGGGFR